MKTHVLKTFSLKPMKNPMKTHLQKKTHENAKTHEKIMKINTDSVTIKKYDIKFH